MHFFRLVVLGTLFFVCITISESCGQKNKDLIKEIDNNISRLETIEAIFSTRIDLSAATDESFDPNKQSNFQRSPIGGIADSTLAAFFNEQEMRVTFLPPYNLVTLDKRETQLQELLGLDQFAFRDNPSSGPKYIPKTVHFKDGTSSKAEGKWLSRQMIKEKYKKTKTDQATNETYEEVDDEAMNDLEKRIWHSRSFNETFAILSGKPIAGIDLQIDLPRRNYKVYSLRKEAPSVESVYGTITLDAINGNEVHTTLPYTDLDQDIQVLAYYKDGRCLKQIGANSNSVLTDQKRDAYEKLLELFKTARKEASKGRINSMDELQNYLERKMPKGLKAALEAKDPQKNAMFRFAGPVSRVDFLVMDTSYQHKYFNVAVELKRDKEEQDYEVATDPKTGKRGIVNNKGEWIVAPNYNEYFRMLNRFYFWDQMDDKGSIYRLIPESFKMEKVNYFVDESEVYKNRYVIVSKTRNGPTGVVDGQTGKLIIPMKYYSLNFDEPGFWTARDANLNKSGVFGLRGNQVLPLNFDYLKYKDGFFYVENHPTSGNKFTTEDVYNTQGENITKGRYDDIEGTFQDGLLLVEKYDRDPNRPGYINSEDYVFINKQGSEVLNFSGDKYRSVKPFSDGLAKVQIRNEGRSSKSRYGFVDKNGKVVIPYIYSTAIGFHDGHAYVEKTEDGITTYGLIDKRGKLVKKLDYDYQSSWKDEKTGKWLLRLHNGVIIDYAGNMVR